MQQPSDIIDPNNLPPDPQPTPSYPPDPSLLNPNQTTTVDVAVDDEFSYEVSIDLPTSEKVVNDYKSPFTNGAEKSLTPTLPIPNGVIDVSKWDEVINMLINQRNALLASNVSEDDQKITAIDENIESLKYSFEALTRMMHIDGNHKDYFKKDTKYTQIVKTADGAGIYIGKEVLPKNKNGGPRTLDNNSAQLIVAQSTHTGSPIRVPMWHSGLAGSLGVYSESQKLSLNIAISQSLSDMGMDTAGISFTGSDAKMNTQILNFMFSNFVSNLEGETRDKLRKNISVLDIPSLLTATLRSMYPDGYPIHHHCINPKCQHTISPERDEAGFYKANSLLDFSKMIYIQSDKLTPECILQMSKSVKDKTSLKDLELYRVNLKAALNATDEFVLNIKDSTYKFMFKVPNLFEYSSAADVWLNEIESMINNTINMDVTLSDRERIANRSRYVGSVMKILDLPKISSWISSILISTHSGDYIADKPEVIYNVLKDLTNIDGVKDDIEKAINTFKLESTIGYTGFPTYVCPLCETPQDTDSDLPGLIPVNMIGFFFTIMVLHAAQIQGIAF